MTEKSQRDYGGRNEWSRAPGIYILREPEALVKVAAAITRSGDKTNGGEKPVLWSGKTEYVLIRGPH
jgi:hypothetical protein